MELIKIKRQGSETVIRELKPNSIYELVNKDTKKIKETHKGRDFPKEVDDEKYDIRRKVLKNGNHHPNGAIKLDTNSERPNNGRVRIG